MKKMALSCSVFVLAFFFAVSSVWAGSFQDSGYYKTQLGTQSFRTSDSVGVRTNCHGSNYKQKVLLQRKISGSWKTVAHNTVPCKVRPEETATVYFQFEYKNRKLNGTYRILFSSTDPNRNLVGMNWKVSWY